MTQTLQKRQQDCYRITVTMGDERHTCFAYGVYETVEGIAQNIATRMGSDDWEISLQTPIEKQPAKAVAA